MIKFITENWQVLAGMIGAIVAWFGGRELKRTEYRTKEAGALAELQKVYDKYIEHDRERMDEAFKRISHLETELVQLRSENLAHRKENIELQEQIRNWENRYNSLDKKYTSLKNSHRKLKEEFEKYKKTAK